MDTILNIADFNGTTNRTIKELKLDSHDLVQLLQAHQSHHQGIETSMFTKPLPGLSSTNRTIKELKQCVAVIIIIQKSVHQSHHQGIETNLLLKKSFFSQTTNRTIKELKLI